MVTFTGAYMPGWCPLRDRIQHSVLDGNYLLKGGDRMTQAEWLDDCQFMREPMLALMDIVHKMNISEPVTVALNKDGMSWAETDEAGHLYEFDIMPSGSFNIRCDRNSYFSDKDLAAMSRAVDTAATE